MNSFKMKGQNFEAASWTQLISSNFKDHTKRPAIIHSLHSVRGNLQNCPEAKELDYGKKSLLDNRLSC